MFLLFYLQSINLKCVSCVFNPVSKHFLEPRFCSNCSCKSFGGYLHQLCASSEMFSQSQSVWMDSICKQLDLGLLRPFPAEEKHSLSMLLSLPCTKLWEMFKAWEPNPALNFSTTFSMTCLLGSLVFMMLIVL
ncbi:hypothetical protein ATANTOWER_018944 [Ataeniobius toweri]|uniref:Uncharacterized protein n=1 Tax=Ataeniobius toweri TaxID=208326 RepID=A0ABU7A720_9TELE|nr:hypothetical protein [Ataeniobius toweri]